MIRTDYDVIVLGLGVMGSAAAWACAARGARVCGIEQYGMAHNLGSSHGDVRVIRKAYFEHPDYVPLLHAAYEGWQRLEEQAQTPLLIRTGVLMTGARGSETLTGLEQCYTRNQLPHERLDYAALRNRFPRFHLPEDHEGFCDPSGGYLFAEQCVEQFWLQARAHGAELGLHEAAVEWRASGSDVEVTTDQRTITARSLILALGAWSRTGTLGVDLPLKVVRKVQLWYSFADCETLMPPDVPVYFHEMPYGAIYGFPAYGAEAIKIAEHTGGQTITGPDELDRALYAEDEAGTIRFLQEVFNVQPERDRFSVCMYTTTPDGNFILDQHPDHPQVSYAAGFSGHGFKFGPVIGEIMADVALNGATQHPIHFLRSTRFSD